MWLNEYHADFLARDRLAEARRAAARHHLIDSLRRQPDRRRTSIAARVLNFSRRLRSLLLQTAATRTGCSNGSRCEAAPLSTREPYFEYGERADKGANEADGRFSSLGPFQQAG